MQARLFTLAFATSLAVPTLAHANDPPAPATRDDVSPFATTPPPAPSPRVDDSLHGAPFSGGRLVAEILAGGLVGSLAGLAIYNGSGGGFSGTWLGLGANFVTTPLVVWGTGKLLGGDGSLGYTYVGAAIAFSAPTTTPQDAALALSLGVAFMPITSAVMYEATSHFKWKQWQALHPVLSIAPIAHHQHVAGGGAQLSLSF